MPLQSVLTKGRPWHSVAINEAHEMLINKSYKLSITKSNADNINLIVKYLPYRSKLLEKVNLELIPEETAKRSPFNSSENLKQEANIKAQKTNKSQLLSNSLQCNWGLINPFTKKLHHLNNIMTSLMFAQLASKNFSCMQVLT